MVDLYSKDIRTTYRRALVTGGAGFIGSHLVDALLRIGLEVISVDDFSAGKQINIHHNLRNPRFRSVTADITEIDTIREYFVDVDIVFHEACSKNTVCMRDPARDLDVNAKGTLNVLLCAKEAGVKRVVHASTGSVYGEPQYFPTDEMHPLNPVSYYGVSKLAGERYAQLFNSLHGFDTIVLRYFHVYGPRQDNSDVGGVVSIFSRRAYQGQNLIIYGDGTQLRSFTHVSDVVRINLLAALDNEMVGREFNCASGVKVTIQELADQVLSYYADPSLKIEYSDWKPGDIIRFDVDNSALRERGFSFKTDFHSGLRHTIEWTHDFLSQHEAIT